MMSSPRQVDDEQLVQYLLGAVPEPEAERLDQLSVTDDEFAQRLSAVEYDLVDGFVKGELSGEILEKFRASYLSSPSRQDKVRFARAFAARDNRSSAVLTGNARTAARAATQSRVWPRPAGRWRLFPSIAWIPQWGAAAVAVLLVIVAGYLLRENVRLRGQVTQAQMQRSQLESRIQELQQGPQEAASGNVKTGQQPATANTPVPRVFAFILAPQMRGAGDITSIQLPPSTDFVAAQLNLESDDFADYRVALKDLTTGRVIWRSDILKPKAKGVYRAVSIRFPASVLKQETYSFELTGASAEGATESVGSYVFRVTRK